MNIGRLIVLYAAFAVISTLINLGLQRAVLSFGNTGAFFAAAVLCGTAGGLLVKYLLDKRWIFADRSSGARAHGRKFGLYTAMGVVTTAIFWGMETTFWLIWHTDAMRETGAVIGLAIGYVVKYFLDRRFVFDRTSQMPASA